MPITNATVVPIVMAARLFNEYQKRTVFAARTDRTWQGALANGGNTIRISKGAPQAVADYAVNGTIVYANADAVHVVDIGVPKQKSWSVKLDDIPALQSSANLLDDAVRQAGIALAEQVDADVKAEFDTSGAYTAGPSITLDHDASGGLTPNDLQIPLLHRILDIAKMPREGRWIMCGPYTAEVLQKVSLETAVLNAPVVSELQNGRIGTFGGFTWYVYDGSYVAEPSWASNKGNAAETWYYGNDTAVAFVDQLNRTEQLRLQDTFADAVRGLYTYGVKSVAPARLYRSAVAVNNAPED